MIARNVVSAGRFSDPHVQLMLRVQNGDENAFARLVNVYQHRLIGLFYHRFTDIQVAEDLTQEVFLRVYRARQTYRPTAKFITWLFTIAHNLASNTQRDRRKCREIAFGVDEHESRLEENAFSDDAARMPQQEMERAELRSVVQSAIETLDERQRKALLLNRMDEMSYAEVAALLGMTPVGVKALLSRARQKLRGRLRSYMN